jgi:tetratricopeptide (TPR) repeat protein
MPDKPLGLESGDVRYHTIHQQVLSADQTENLDAGVCNIIVDKFEYNEPRSDDFVVIGDDGEEVQSRTQPFVGGTFASADHASSGRTWHQPDARESSQRRLSQHSYAASKTCPQHGLSILSSHEGQIMKLTHLYLFGFRQPSGQHGGASSQVPNIDGVGSGHLHADLFYRAAFNATQSSVSTVAADREHARIEWTAATSSAQISLRQPTPRLVVSVLSFYSNAHVPSARSMHKRNFDVLYMEACKWLPRDSALCLLLRYLARCDMSNPGAESTTMDLLVQILDRDHANDFDSNYEARELQISAQRNLGTEWTFREAHRLCDELIAYSEEHAPPSDQAPVWRACRRKGRIFFAQGNFDEAWDIFEGIHARWVANGSPARASKEYMVFEDMAKICRARGQYAEAKRWYLHARSLSDLAYAPIGISGGSRAEEPPNLNSLRLTELIELMEKAYLAVGGEGQERRPSQKGDAATIVESHDHAHDKWKGKERQEDEGVQAKYLAREIARW